MHVFARWQHQDADVDLLHPTTGARVGKGFDDFNTSQVGGIIFF